MSDFSAVAQYGKERLGWTDERQPVYENDQRVLQLLESAATLPAENAQVALILAEAQVHATLACADAQNRIADWLDRWPLGTDNTPVVTVNR